MADISIDSAASASTARGMRSMVWVTANIGYFFFVDADGDFKYTKSVDGGQTWAAPVTIRTGTVPAFDVWFDQWTPGDSGTVIYTWYLDNGDSDTHFRTLDTASDTLGTERTVAAGINADSGYGQWITGAKMRGGNLLVAYHLRASDGASATFRSTNAGVNWTLRSNVSDASPGDVSMIFPGNEADANDAWILHHDASADALTLKVHDDSANTNSESSTITTVVEDSTDGTGQYAFSGAIRHSDGHLIVAVESALDTPGSDLAVFDINGTASITQLSFVITNVDDRYYPAVHVNDDDDIYIAYIGSQSGLENLGVAAGVYYVVSTDNGSTWGSEQAYSAGVSDWRQTWTSPNGPRFAVAWRDVSSNELLTNYDNSVAPVTAGPFPHYTRRALLGGMPIGGGVC